MHAELGKKGLSPAPPGLQARRRMTGREKLTFSEWAQISLVPDVELLAPAVAQLCATLAARGAGSEALDGVRLAVTEALANAIKHGAAAADDRAVRLRWMWQDEWLEIRISEPGHFMPDDDWTELPDDPLAESGRGGFLIAQHIDELEHGNVRGRHMLRLRKRLGRPPAPPATTAELEQTLDAMTEDLSASYETLSALFRLAEALATTENLAAFATHALNLRALIEADTMHVRLRDPAGQLRLLVVAADGCDFPQNLSSAGSSIEAEVHRTGLERTTDEHTAFAPDDPLRQLRGATFVCPVYFQSRQLGVCVVGRQKPGAYFTAGQLALARSTAEFLGIAYTNADLQANRFAQLRAERELEIAAQIQLSLLPREFPQRDDWRVQGMCANALETGGDFFDVLEVAGGLLLVIADVMGKGMPAALIAVVLRTAVRSHAALAPSPGNLLNRVNLQLAPDLEKLGIFVTAQAVFLEAKSARIRYASAGHCPIILVSARGNAVRELEEGGLPLGVSRDESYADHGESLGTGETMILVTDGLLEAPDREGRELGVEGLAQAAQRLHAVDFTATCAQLLDVVRQRDAGRQPTDDRTLLIAQRLP